MMMRRSGVLLSLACWIVSAQSQKPLKIEVLLETSCQVGGISAQDPVSNQKICFDTAPILTQDDLKSAVLTAANGKPQVMAYLKDSVIDRTYRITMANLGNHAAVLINNKILETLTIKGGVRGVIAFQGFTDKQQAQETANQINDQKR